MSEELKPCPFCGGDAEIERMGSGRQSMIYACTDCGCRLETSETFIGPHCSWNTRVEPVRKLKLPEGLAAFAPHVATEYANGWNTFRERLIHALKAANVEVM